MHPFSYEWRKKHQKHCSLTIYFKIYLKYTTVKCETEPKEKSKYISLVTPQLCKNCLLTDITNITTWQHSDSNLSLITHISTKKYFQYKYIYKYMYIRFEGYCIHIFQETLEICQRIFIITCNCKAK